MRSMKGLKIQITGIFSFFRIPYNSLLMDTFLFPPKTTVVGMLGAAAGWNENEFLRNLKNILYGVIIKNPGELFHETAQIYKNKDAPIYPITKKMIYKPEYEVFIASEEIDKVEKIYSTLQDPKYVISLGDSENLFFPKDRKFLEIMDITKSSSDNFRCILPKEIYDKYYQNYKKIDDNIIPPKEAKMPIDFTGSGNKRRFIGINVVFYSGIEINMKDKVEANVWDFNGSELYLF